jgi:3-methyladenine DNA glycosylase/8-oxoguanine DNA glycosylase
VSRVSLSTAIAEVSARDPVLAHLVEVAGPIKYPPRDPDGHFGALVRSIVYQQLAGRAAQAIHKRVRATVRGALTPAALARVSDEALRAAGLSANKLASLRDLSTKILDGTVDLEKSPRQSEDEIVAGLVIVRGIGRWTAEM